MERFFCNPPPPPRNFHFVASGVTPRGISKAHCLTTPPGNFNALIFFFLFMLLKETAKEYAFINNSFPLQIVPTFK